MMNWEIYEQACEKALVIYEKAIEDAELELLQAICKKEDRTEQ